MTSCCTVFLALASIVATHPAPREESVPGAAVRVASDAAGWGYGGPACAPCEASDVDEQEAHKRRATNADRPAVDCALSPVDCGAAILGSLEVQWVAPFAEALRVAISTGLPRGPPRA